MSIHLDVQIASRNPGIPDKTTFQYWANKIRSSVETTACLRVVDESEARKLNDHYRKINQATNVLSFPAEIPSCVEINHLGDVVICAPLVVNEAQQRGKKVHEHWAHLLIHGLLHLQGYDHTEEQEAKAMESLEVEILSKLNILNPYEKL